MKRLKLKLKSALLLLKENSLLAVASFIFYDLFKIRKEFPLRVGGVDLVVRSFSPDMEIARECLVYGDFSILEELSPSHLPQNFIVDAGGYIGTAAIAMARAFPEATIVTLEPSSENFKLLQANTMAFENIIPLNMALTDKPRTLKLYNRGKGECGFTIISNPADHNATELQQIKSTSIVEILKDYSADGIDILKIDIEGAEKGLLEASGDWMPQVGIIFTELHDRIVPGCSRTYFKATEGMRDAWADGEKLVAVNDAYFEQAEAPKQKAA